MFIYIFNILLSQYLTLHLLIGWSVYDRRFCYHGLVAMAQFVTVRRKNRREGSAGDCARAVVLCYDALSQLREAASRARHRTQRGGIHEQCEGIFRLMALVRGLMALRRFPLRHKPVVSKPMEFVGVGVVEVECGTIGVMRRLSRALRKHIMFVQNRVHVHYLSETVARSGYRHIKLGSYLHRWVKHYHRKGRNGCEEYMTDNCYNHYENLNNGSIDLASSGNQRLNWWGGHHSISSQTSAVTAFANYSAATWSDSRSGRSGGKSTDSLNLSRGRGDLLGLSVTSGRAEPYSRRYKERNMDGPFRRVGDQYRHPQSYASTTLSKSVSKVLAPRLEGNVQHHRQLHTTAIYAATSTYSMADIGIMHRVVAAWCVHYDDIEHFSFLLKKILFYSCCGCKLAC